MIIYIHKPVDNLPGFTHPIIMSYLKPGLMTMRKTPNQNAGISFRCIQHIYRIVSSFLPGGNKLPGGAWSNARKRYLPDN